jgi:hypothetical protein
MTLTNVNNHLDRLPQIIREKKQDAVRTTAPDHVAFFRCVMKVAVYR